MTDGDVLVNLKHTAVGDKGMINNLGIMGEAIRKYIILGNHNGEVVTN